VYFGFGNDLNKPSAMEVIVKREGGVYRGREAKKVVMMM
jgi:hypothetical protein